MIRLTALVALMALATPTTARERLVQVPFVGCPSDGQTGPLPAPTATRNAPRLPSAQARQLAYYVSESGPAVLAPRGWHCFGLYGSNGSILVVAPRRLRAEELFGHRVRFRGPAIVASFSDGQTSGRFSVWSAIARYFPQFRHLIDRQDWADIMDGSLPSGPFVHDRIVSRTARSIRLVTPAWREGQGTTGYLAKGNLPVHSMLHLMGSGAETGLLTIDARLSRPQQVLVQAILDNPGGNE
ncbi:MAG TPA: hypothetical protein VJM15_02800 [Sphingomicrobium sp.]|nr:hypothetical protein [Sphingomicrobium sp.]